jgi:hypothetical protein
LQGLCPGKGYSNPSFGSRWDMRGDHHWADLRCAEPASKFSRQMRGPPEWSHVRPSDTCRRPHRPATAKDARKVRMARSRSDL